MSTFISQRNTDLDYIFDLLTSNQKIVFVQSIVALTVVWWTIATIFNATDAISSPIMVVEELYSLLTTQEWVSHVVATSRRVLLGFVLTIIIGTFLGVLMGWYNFWDRALEDYVAIGLAFPSLFAAVFAAMWFGVSDVTPMVASALIAFPFLTVTVYEGVKGIDRDLVKMSSAFNVSRSQIVRQVIVKSILPEWFGGIRYALAISWKITVLAELVAADNGIGYMIQVQLQQLSLDGVLAWTFIFTVLMMIVEYGVLQPVENHLFAWRNDSSIAWV